jgi:hypothetical protein
MFSFLSVHLPLLRPPPLCRKLDLAVREEDYTTAAAAKAEVDLLLERLPSSKVVLSGLLSKLEDGDSSERQATIQQLGKLGDAAAVPSLAGCLHDADPSTAEAAEEALWACFMRQAEVGACSRACVLRLKCWRADLRPPTAVPDQPCRLSPPPLLPAVAGALRLSWSWRCIGVWR